LEIKVALQTFFFKIDNWLIYCKNMKKMCCIILLLFSTQHTFSFAQQKSNNITIDFQKTPIKEKTEILLDIGWEFYWNKLIAPGNFKENNPV